MLADFNEAAAIGLTHGQKSIRGSFVKVRFDVMPLLRVRVGGRVSNERLFVIDGDRHGGEPGPVLEVVTYHRVAARLGKMGGELWAIS